MQLQRTFCPNSGNLPLPLALNSISKPFSIERFEKGELIDEHGAAGVAH